MSEEWGEPYTTGTGQSIRVHKKSQCEGTHCVIHNPSDHSMREFPTHWRDDIGVMERICPHGIGHPDPDGLTYIAKVHGQEAMRLVSVHGCCGDCSIKGYVKTLREKTPCTHCGATPIEYHHPNHPQKQNDRVSSLVAQSNPSRRSPVPWQRILEEIQRCTPLCRSCHMKEDGRLTQLRVNTPRKKGQIITSAQPCVCCKKLTKPMRNKMCVTCDNHHSGRRLRKTNSCDGCCGHE